MEQMKSVKVSPRDLAAFCIAAMRKSGINEEDARLTAEVLVTTDTLTTFTHGTRQLRGLLKNFRTGRLSATAHEEIAAEGPAWAIVDAHYAMPPAVSYRSMELAMRKAKACGIGYVGVKHSSHYGAAGFYANLAAQHDMFGLSMCNVDPCMTVPGAKGKVLGTNPIAYAAPAGAEKPIYLDIATSAVAATKIFSAKALGKQIPDNWLVDEEGMPTTDPSQYPAKGAQLPMAAHKGYGLAVMVEILTAVLTGAAILSGVKSWVADTTEPTDEGHAFIAIDIAQMMPLGEFKARMDGMIREIHAAPRAKGTDRIYLPGEIELEKRDIALVEGIALPPDVVASLRGLAEDVGVDATQFNLNLGK
ncbi:MAG: Ldh family oxidoreductase [Chloroflexi bacterium]|nr:Ldh family oxidoreductase [Chloroflexota bacterium]